MKRTPTEEEKKAILDAVFAPLEGEPPVRSSEMVVPQPPSDTCPACGERGERRSNERDYRCMNIDCDVKTFRPRINP
jgi:hypothetical protein